MRLRVDGRGRLTYSSSWRGIRLGEHEHALGGPERPKGSGSAHLWSRPTRRRPISTTPPRAATKALSPSNDSTSPGRPATSAIPARQCLFHVEEIELLSLEHAPRAGRRIAAANEVVDQINVGVPVDLGQTGRGTILRRWPPSRLVAARCGDPTQQVRTPPRGHRPRAGRDS